MKQLTLEDIMNDVDYSAESTSKQFLSNTKRKYAYAVDFYQNKRQMIDWFEVDNRLEAEEAAEKKHGSIIIVKSYKTNRTLSEIELLD